MYAAQQTVGYAGQSTSPAGETRQSEITEEMNHLSRVVDHLGMTINQITDRLKPVRRQAGNTNAKEQSSPPEPVLCMVADSIRAQRKLVEMYRVSLQAALNELEVPA